MAFMSTFMRAAMAPAAAAPTGAPTKRVSNEGLCYSVGAAAGGARAFLEALPDLVFRIDGATLTIPSSQYMFPHTGTDPTLTTLAPPNTDVVLAASPAAVAVATERGLTTAPDERFCSIATVTCTTPVPDPLSRERDRDGDRSRR